MEKAIIKVHKRGIIVIPKRIREMLSIDEGTLLELRVENGKILLSAHSAEEAEKELDREEENFWAKRE